MKRKFYIVFALIFSALLLTLSCSGEKHEGITVDDVKEGTWYYESVMWAYKNGYVAGTTDTTFSPKQNVKRAEFITILAKYDGVNLENADIACDFTDVENGSYYYAYAAWGAHNGLISGTGDNKFSPEKPITREELCVILKKYCEFKKIELYTAKYAHKITDSAKISSWAKTSVDFAQKASLMSGYANKINPKGNLTGAEAVTVLYALEKAKTYKVPEEAVDASNQRQLLLEDYTVDYASTTADIKYVDAVKTEQVFVYDKFFERNNAIYQNIVKAPDGTYRMYYKATDVFSKRRICYIESKDGLTWTRPTNGYSYEGEKMNIVTNDGYSPDNLFVFYDTNPNCTGTRWKGIYGQWGDGLFLESSPDGLSFFSKGEDKLLGDPVSNGGMFFDTLNTMYYDELRGKYVAFVRGLHEGDNYVMTPEQIETGPDYSVRDIRYIESTDLVNWSKPIPLKYDDIGDYEMYANAITPYYRAKQLYVGLPTRLQNIAVGQYVTSVYLMSSRDLINWDITKEPYLTPEDSDTYNYPRNGFPCVGIIETSDKEMSFYMAEADDVLRKQVLYRYTLRIDGFRCAKCDGKGVFETKYLDYYGSILEVNFKTSANGYIKVTATDTNGKSITTEKLTGDFIAKEIFTNGELNSLRAGAIRLTFEMKNAELYSYKFN